MLPSFWWILDESMMARRLVGSRNNIWLVMAKALGKPA